MTKVMRCVCALLASAACLYGAMAGAQQWPNRAVRIIVPFPPGQAADIITRIVAERLTPALGQQVAGLLMWVGGGFVFLAVMIVLLLQWFGTAETVGVRAAPARF